MRLFKKLRKKLDYLSEGERDLIYKAYRLAAAAHEGQARADGEPYITHPVAVACILANMKMDYQTVIGGLLHDVIEDTTVGKQTIDEAFGEAVGDIVDGLSKLTQIEFVSKAQVQAESFCKMVMAMAKDIRVIVIKLADRLHNIRTLEALRPDKQRRIAKETLDIYAPIANRLGMRDFSVEMQEHSFAAAYPNRYRVIKEAVRKARGNRKKVLLAIAKKLNSGFSERQLPPCSIAGREKHLYSIYRKMREKHLTLNQIMDVYAFRIVTPDVDTCYRVLGMVHGLYKPVPERFKDYIAIPKANGYQSLHTTLFGPYGLPIEIQIRTGDMDNMATNGVAAHWLYKSSDPKLAYSKVRAQKWVRNLLEIQSQSGSSMEFVENVKDDLFSDEVYVFTPKGKILELPAGATAVDFAYAVHTDIGNHCVAVKVDRRLAPLSSPLLSGQTIEIITSANGRPSGGWLSFVRTPKARSGIRHYLKSQQQTQSAQLGEKLFEQALAKYALTPAAVPEEALASLCDEMSLSGSAQLYKALGAGDQVPALVAQRLILKMQQGEAREGAALEHGLQPLLVRGTEGVVLTFSPCCLPIPGDPIVGLLNQGKGIEVHAEVCSALDRLRGHPENYTPMRWASQVEGEFEAAICVQAANQRGVLADLAVAIAAAAANIEDILVQEREGEYYLVNIKLLVTDRVHLARVMRRLRQLKAVAKITRLRKYVAT